MTRILLGLGAILVSPPHPRISDIVHTAISVTNYIRVYYLNKLQSLRLQLLLLGILLLAVLDFVIGCSIAKGTCECKNYTHVHTRAYTRAQTCTYCTYTCSVDAGDGIFHLIPRDIILRR